MKNHTLSQEKTCINYCVLAPLVHWNLSLPLNPTLLLWGSLGNNAGWEYCDHNTLDPDPFELSFGYTVWSCQHYCYYNDIIHAGRRLLWYHLCLRVYEGKCYTAIRLQFQILKKKKKKKKLVSNFSSLLQSSDRLGSSPIEQTCHCSSLLSLATVFGHLDVLLNNGNCMT